MVAATTFPKNVSEYDAFGGIGDAPIDLFESDVTGLMLPANAESIVEGYCYPGRDFAEGPFGEFTGYYGRPSGTTPYIDIHTIRYRSDPILTCALMAEGSANECGLFWGMSKAAKVWADLDALGVPGVQGVWSPPEAAGWGMTVVSIKQLYAGHAAQSMALAAQWMGGAYFTKYIKDSPRGRSSPSRSTSGWSSGGKTWASNGIRRRSMFSRSRRPTGRGGGGQMLPLALWRNESSIRQPGFEAVLLWRSSA